MHARTQNPYPTPQLAHPPTVTPTPPILVEIGLNLEILSIPIVLATTQSALGIHLRLKCILSKNVAHM